MYRSTRVSWSELLLIIILTVVIIWAVIVTLVYINNSTHKIISHTNTVNTKTLTGYEACDRISHLMLSIGEKRDSGITIYNIFKKERALPKNDVYIANILTKYAYAHPEFNPEELRLRTLQECDRIVFKSTHINIPKDVVI